MAGGFKPQGPPSFGQRVGNVAINAARSTGLAQVFSTKPRAKYASGARTILRLNGKPVAFAFSIDWAISTTQTEIRTIDDYLPYEFAPKQISVEGSMSGWHIPEEGGATAMLLQSDVLSFLFHKYITIEVRDVATDALLFFTSKAVITSRSESIKVDALGQVTLKWKAIGWKDEKEPKQPSGYNGEFGKKVKQASLPTLIAGPAKAISDPRSIVDFLKAKGKAKGKKILGTGGFDPSKIA